MTWRGWLGFAGSTSAVVLIYRNLWIPAALVGAGVLVIAVLFVRAEVAAFRAETWQEPEPEPVPVARVEWAPFSHPPWETAPVPVVPSVPDRGGLEAGGRHRRERGLRDAVAGALRTARQTSCRDRQDRIQGPACRYPSGPQIPQAADVTAPPMVM